MTTTLLPALQIKVDTLVNKLESVPKDRRVILQQLVDVVVAARDSTQPLRLQFICTHNSRRSQLAQVWAQVAAHYFGLIHIETYSGGTEVTAFNPRAIAALERAGFSISTDTLVSANPRLRVSYSSKVEPLVCFSKCYDDDANPEHEFVAVMTCGEADQHCPTILGVKKLALLYSDPKISDDTAHERETYDSRSDQIASELLWVFQRASQS